MEWGEEEKREGELEAGRVRGPADAGWRRAASFSELPSACSVGAVSSGGRERAPGWARGKAPTEDDVDLSVLHALGRSGCFS